MIEQTGGVRPAVNRPATTSTVAEPTDIERARRRWRLHRQFTTARKISAALDAKCAETSALTSARTGEVDYDAMGFTLGFDERRARGLALLEQERAA